MRDVSSGAITFKKELAGAVWGCAFEPNDGKYLVAGDASGKHTVWDVLTGETTHEFKHPWCVNEKTNTRTTTKVGHGYSRRSKHAAATKRKNKGKRGGRGERRTSKSNSEEQENRGTKGGGVSFSNDGTLCAVSDFTNKVHVLQVKKKYTVVASISHEGGVFGVAIGSTKVTKKSSSKTMLATADQEGQKVIVRSLPDCQVLHVFEHSDDVNCVAFSPDGTMLAAGDDGNKVSLRNSTTGRLLHIFSYNAPVNSVTFDARGMSLAVCDENLTIRNVVTGDITNVYPHLTKLWGCAFSPSKSSSIVGAVDDGKTITLRDIETDEHEHVFYTNKNTEEQQQSSMNRASAAANGGPPGGAKEKEALALVAAPSVVAIVESAGFIAVASKTNVLIMDTMTGIVMSEYPANKDSEITCVSICSGHQLFALGDDKGRVTIRSIATSKVLFTCTLHKTGERSAESAAIKALAFSEGMTNMVQLQGGAGATAMQGAEGTVDGVALLASCDTSKRILVRTLLDPTKLLYSIEMEQIAISLEFVPGQTSTAKLCVADSYDTVHFFVPPPAGSGDSSTLVSVGDVWNYTNSGTLKVSFF